MRRLPVFLLLTVVFAFLVAACGGGREATGAPTDIVASWSQAINGGDDEAAAKLFAPDAEVIQDGQQRQLKGQAEALAFNASLPCGRKLVTQSVKSNDVTATFTLTRRPEHMCDGTGESAVTVFRIEDGKIALWHELPADAADAQTA